MGVTSLRSKGDRGGWWLYCRVLLLSGGTRVTMAAAVDTESVGVLRREGRDRLGDGQGEDGHGTPDEELSNDCLETNVLENW